MVVSLHAGGEVITATGRHPVWVVEGAGLFDRPITEELGDDNLPTLTEGRWVEARYLEVGDRLLTPRGTLRVDDLFHETTTTEVFNLQITHSHTYTVGTTGVLVHNDSPVAKNAPAAGCDTTDYCAAKGFRYVQYAKDCRESDGGGSKDGTGCDSWTSYTVKKCGKSAASAGTKTPHGHHVVMKGKFSELTGPSQQILCKHDINPFCGCANLVVNQNWCHSTRYAEHVLAELKKADAEGRSISKKLEELAEWHERCKDSDKADDSTDE